MAQKTIFQIGIIIVLLAIAAGLTYIADQRGAADMPAPTDSVATTTNEVVATSPAQISGRTWVWQRTVMNDGSVTEPRNAGAFTLTFDADGRVSGTTDCNSFGGNVSASTDGMIDFGALASTKKYCLNSQEAEFTTALSRTNGYLFDDDGNLVLTLEFDSGSMFFRAQ